MGRSAKTSRSSDDTFERRYQRLLQYLIKRHRRTVSAASEVDIEVEDARKSIRRGARTTDHRFRL